MDDLLNICIPKLSFTLPFLKKYVDDIIAAIPLAGEDEILHVFIANDRLLQMTMEKELDSSVPF